MAGWAGAFIHTEEDIGQVIDTDTEEDTVTAAEVAIELVIMPAEGTRAETSIIIAIRALKKQTTGLLHIT